MTTLSLVPPQPCETASSAPLPGRPVPFPAPAGRPQARSVLFEVEFRKTLDSRTGLAVTVATVVASVVVLSLDLAHLPKDTVVVRTLIGDAVMPPGFFLPALAVMAMTAEWSRRTGLVTFTLSPWRNRVLLAKAGAALVLGVLVTGAVILIALAAAFGAGTLTGHLDGSRAGAAALAAFAGVAIVMLMAAAWGALIPSIPPALAVCYLLPGVWGSVLSGLGGWARWVDIGGALARITGLRLAGTVPETLVAVGLWVLLPTAAGLVVGTRREVR